MQVGKSEIQALVVSRYSTAHIWDVLFKSYQIHRVGQAYSRYEVEFRRIERFFVNDWLSCLEEAIIFLIVAAGLKIHSVESGDGIVHVKTILIGYF